MIDSQLLCTFSNKKELTEMVLIIKESAPLSMKKLYVLQRVDNQNELMVTINAVNHIIRDANNGVLDTSYRLQWENYRNSILLTNKDGLNIINTRLKEIIDLEK